MARSGILRDFFENQHRRWRSRAYTLIQFTCKNAPLDTPYGKWLGKKTGEKGTAPPREYRPKGD